MLSKYGIAFLSVFVLVSCNRESKKEFALNDETTVTVLEAKVVLNPTNAQKPTGTVTFTEVPGGVRIVAKMQGLTPGKHGFHVHEKGDCSDHGNAAGAHFNPTNMPHGGPDSPKRHVGDLGNIEADSNGNAVYDRVDRVIALNGNHSIIGKSIVVHADADDFTTQPTGNSGGRIACGVIEAIK